MSSVGDDERCRRATSGSEIGVAERGLERESTGGVRASRVLEKTSGKEQSDETAGG